MKQKYTHVNGSDYIVSLARKIICLPLCCFLTEIEDSIIMITEMFKIRMLKIRLESLSEVDFKSSKGVLFCNLHA